MFEDLTKAFHDLPMRKLSLLSLDGLLLPRYMIWSIDGKGLKFLKIFYLRKDNIKVGDRSRGRPEGSPFNSYYTDE